jgi:hypothetical protein
MTTLRLSRLFVGYVALFSLFLGVRRAQGQAAERRATIFYTGAIHGTLEPCGCTSDPLGDISRMTGLVRRAQKQGPVLVVDAGNLSYPATDVPASRQEAADLKAAFLGAELAKLPFGGAALGEADLARGGARVKPPRLAANVKGPFVEASRLLEVGKIKVGVLGVADPAVARREKLAAEDPVIAARREAEGLRRRGAEVVIALVPLERPQARLVARGADVDFVVVGKNVEDGVARAELVGKAYLLVPAVELQKVGRLEVVMRNGRLVDAGGAEAARLRVDELDRLLADLDGQLAAWKKDPSADAAFVASKKKERDELAAERARLAGERWQPPATGSYFTNELVPLRRALPRDTALASAMRVLDREIGRANLKHAEPPPVAGPGRAAFVGDTACAKCHKKQLSFWRTTVHAHAWKTLVDGGKTGDDECVSCHVTGYGEVGGSSLGYTKKLEAVQCETCHGPGSLHVKQEGLEDPPAVRLETPESTCKRCHNTKHSDTFQYQAYLRDVLGVGHGVRSREKLGAGPTGHELRSAAMARAKAAGEAQKKAIVKN